MIKAIAGIGHYEPLREGGSCDFGQEMACINQNIVKDHARICRQKPGSVPFCRPGPDNAICRHVKAGRLRITTDIYDAVATADYDFRGLDLKCLADALAP